MKKIILVFLAIFCILILMNCQRKNPTEPEITGYRLKKLMDYNSSGGLSCCYLTYEYNAENKISKIAVHQANTDQIISYAVYERSADGKITTKRMYDYPDILVGIREFFYDAEGRPNTVNAYTADMTLNSYSVFDYSVDSLLNTVSTYYPGQPAEEAHKIFEYNASGKLVKSTIYMPYMGGLMSSDEFEYGDNGKISKRSIYTTSNTLSEYRIYDYNENALYIKEWAYTASDVLSGYIIPEYEPGKGDFDWTEQTSIYNLI